MRAGEESVSPDLGRRITVRIGASDDACLRDRAAQEGLKPSSWVRRATLEALHGGPAVRPADHLMDDLAPSCEHRDQIVEAASAVNRVGRNLNQIAKAMNAGASMPADAAATFSELLEAVRAIQTEMGGTP